MDPSDLDLAYHDVFAWSGVAESHRKRTWPGKSRKTASDHAKGLHIPRLTEVGYQPRVRFVSFGIMTLKCELEPNFPFVIVIRGKTSTLLEVLGKTDP